MNKILCSTGSLITRANGRNHRLLKDFAHTLQCDGFEFLIYESFYEKLDVITDELSADGLVFPSVHCDKKIGELIAEENELAFELFDINCRAAVRLGAEKLVLHLWNGIISDSNFSANMSAYPRLAEISEKYGLLLTIENVVCNCGSPMEHFYELAERYPQISFTFDTKMAEFHGELSKIYEPTIWRENIRHLHINDYGGGIMDWQNLRTLHIGSGHVDFESFFEFVKKVGYCGDFTVEANSVNTDGSVDIHKLNMDFERIRGYIA